MPDASQTELLVLLGAGASAEADIPTAVPMTQKAIDLFERYTGLEKEVRILRYVVGRLQCWRALKREPSPERIDIEALFAAVQALAVRQELAIAPFVDRWDPFIEEVGNAGEIFKRTNDALLRLLMKMVWLNEPQKVDYLLPLVQQGRETILTIATLNYDNTIELEGKVLGVPVSTGIEKWCRHGKFRKPEKGIELLKLHGSIDWKISKGAVWQRNTMSYRSVRQVSEEKVQRLASPATAGEVQVPYLPAVLFGAGNKLKAYGPFLDLLQTFQERLEEHNDLLVVGYSFRDEHINEIIQKWINQSETRRIIWVDREEATPTDNAFYRVEHGKLRDRFEFRSVGTRKGLADFFQC